MVVANHNAGGVFGVLRIQKNPKLPKKGKKQQQGHNRERTRRIQKELGNRRKKNTRLPDERSAVGGGAEAIAGKLNGNETKA